MGKIFDNINTYIMEAMKNKEPQRANAYKNVKAKMLEFKTAKNAKPLDDAAEVAILNKMVAELKNDAAEFIKNGRNDLAESYTTEAGYIETFLPKAASKEEVEAAIAKYIEANGPIAQPQMGLVIKFVKEQFANVDGKMLADAVKSHIG